MTCLRCGKHPVYQTGIWCIVCIETVCCKPRRGYCVHKMGNAVGLGRSTSDRRGMGVGQKGHGRTG